MQTNSLDDIHVAILVSDDFEQVEMTEPRQALEQAGAKTVLVSTKRGQISGMNHDQKADTFDVDLTFDEANPDEFDGILLPGGALNADFLRMHPKAQEFVRQIDKSDRPLAVICHAPWLLISSGCIKGRTLTSYYTIQDDIRNAGGNWVDQEVVRDDNWVSSRSPEDLGIFCPAVIALFVEYKKRDLQDIISVS